MWYHMWHHSVLSHVSIWHHRGHQKFDIACDITSLSSAKAAGPSSPYVAAGATSSSSSEAWSMNPSGSSTPSPSLPPVSAASAALKGVVVLPSATGQGAARGSHHCCTAALLQPLLCSRQDQTICKTEMAQLLWQIIQTMHKTEIAQINQTRDLLKIENHFIDIVRWNLFNWIKGSLERGGDCIVWTSQLMKQFVMCKG